MMGKQDGVLVIVANKNFKFYFDFFWGILIEFFWQLDWK